MTPGPQAWAAAAAALGIMAPFVLHINSPEKKGFQGLLFLLAQCWSLGPHCEGLPWHSASIRPLHCLSPPRRAEARREVDAVCQTFCRGLGVWPEPRTISQPGGNQSVCKLNYRLRGHLRQYLLSALPNSYTPFPSLLHLQQT